MELEVNQTEQDELNVEQQTHQTMGSTNNELRKVKL